MHRFFSFTPRPVLAADHVRGSENPHDQGGRVSGRLAENIVHFARALRAAGIPVAAGAGVQREGVGETRGAETAAAKDAIKGLVRQRDEVKTRRPAPHRHGHLADTRRPLRASLKAGGAVIALKSPGPRSKSPPLV